MFCQTCGAELRDGLRYCNRCGANLVNKKTAPPRLMTLIYALSGIILLVAIIGFAMIFIFGSELMSRGNIEPVTVVFLSVFSLVVLAILALLIKQLSRLIGVYLETGNSSELKSQVKLTDETTKSLSSVPDLNTSFATKLFSAEPTNLIVDKPTRRIETSDLTRPLKKENETSDKNTD